MADPEIKKGEGARSKFHELFIRIRHLGLFRRFGSLFRMLECNGRQHTSAGWCAVA